MSSILVVDDDDVIRKAVRTIPDREGHTTFEADDGSRVLQMLDENHVDVLLTDILMPGWNGLILSADVRFWGREREKMTFADVTESDLKRHRYAVSQLFVHALRSKQEGPD